MFHPESFDRIVCPELPDAHTEPYLFSLVVKHMVHGPCGLLNPACPCMKKNSCKYNYPKDYSEATKYGTNSYPIYRRHDDRHVINIRGSQLDNRWVVPYHPYLLAKFNCHINVEICSTIQAVKYIYKNIYKGHDKILYTLLGDEQDPVVDETKNFQAARWISPPESIWRIFGFDLNHLHPAIICLPVHLENEHVVTFAANQALKPSSFKDLRTIKEVTYTTFRDDALTLGLIESDNTAEMCIEEAACYLMPHALRKLFAIVLVFCCPKNSIQLWSKFQDFLSKDFAQNRDLTPKMINHRVLDIVDNNLRSMGKKLEDFFHTDKDMSLDFDDRLAKDLQTECDIYVPAEDLLAVEQLNVEQKMLIIKSYIMFVIICQVLSLLTALEVHEKHFYIEHFLLRFDQMVT
ncbi:uncharacterized protein LOC142544366 [Primulina tabacum]|uniref:uncharacterized protein LOC142544366 n=1 Tax=Primulina tabacum TaxID=48773 RepID=UPI003F5A45EE